MSEHGTPKRHSIRKPHQPRGDGAELVQVWWVRQWTRWPRSKYRARLRPRPIHLPCPPQTPLLPHPSPLAAFWALFLGSFATYIVQHVVCAYFYRTQNLKRRYNAQWAIVTGASSGVGL